MIGVFLLMLCCPKEVFNGASEGLLLWFQILFPTLFPFLLITDLLMATGGIRMISKVLSVPFGILFRVSGEGSFAVVAGFLCGYPMGAKITADLIRNQSISVEEGTYLLSFCNNTSPIFIMNFLVWKTLDRKELLLPSLVILLGTPVVMSFPFRKIYKSGRKRGGGRNTLGMQRNYIMKKKSVESCMMDSFETIVKVGGYLIIFSVLLELADRAEKYRCNSPAFNTGSYEWDSYDCEKIPGNKHSLSVADRADFYGRHLFYGTDAVDDPWNRTETFRLYHTKTGYRNGSQWIRNTVCEIQFLNSFHQMSIDPCFLLV